MSSDSTKTSASDRRVLAAGQLLAGRYRIGTLLGIGGMGMVYQAHDEELGVEVALKVLRPERAATEEMRARFRQELLLARQVSHRNVVRIHDLGQEGNLDFITMDFVPGRSLRELLQDDPLPLNRAVGMARQLAEALAEAHSKGIVHRDLKPANVLVDAAGEAYITDFGIARSLTLAAAGGLTEPGQIIGTPDYLAPEQARGAAVDPRTDLYALGILLFEMITGQLPFAGESVDEALAQRLAGRPRTFAEVGVDVPPHLEAVVARCLARDPEERYGSAEDLLADLGQGSSRPMLSQPARTALFIALAVVAVVLVLTASISRLRRAPQSENGAATPALEAPRDTAPIAQHAVAVLPMADETGRPDLAWLADGIAEMVATTLGENAELRVVSPRRVVRTLEDLKLDPERLGESDLRLLAELLEVDRLVTGHVRAAAGRLRVEARLTESGAGQLAQKGDLPTEVVRAEAGADEAFALIDHLGDALRGKLVAGSGEAAAAGDPVSSPLSADPQALSAYAAGVDALRGGDLSSAIDDLERAVAADRAFPAAWVRLAEAYIGTGRHGDALEAASRAVEQSAQLGPAAGRLGYEARALLAQLQGDPQAAQKVLKERVARYPNDVEARLALAEAYGAEGRFDDARRELEEVTHRDPGGPRAWYQLGRHAILGGDPRRALDEYLVRALVIYNRLQDEAGRGDVLNAMGAAREELGDLDQAAARYREAAEVRSAIGDQRGLTASLANLSGVDAYRGDYAAAEANLQRAMEICRQLDDREGLADLENRLAFLREQRGLVREALEHYRQALKLRQELGDQRTVAESYTNIGFAYFLLGEYDNAAVYQQRARDLYRELGLPRGEALTAQGLGQLAMVRGDWAAGSKAFLELLEASRALGLAGLDGVAQTNLGRAAQYQGRYHAAFEHYRAAREALEPLGDPRGLVEVALFEASACLELGMDEPAAIHLRQARSLLGQEGDRKQRAELLRLEAESARQGGRPQEAARKLEEARPLAQASGDPSVPLALTISQARLLPAKQAVPLLRTAATEADSLGHVPLSLEARTALAEAQRSAGDPQAAIATVRRALEQARAAAPYAGTFRLEAALALALEARGENAAAAEARQRGRREVARLRGELDEAERQALDQLPEVRSLG